MAAKATAQWTGDKTGNGTYTLASGAAKDVKYTFGGRFEDKGGSTPEELVAAAYASCFIMYLTAVLPDNKHQGITSEAIASLSKDDRGPHVSEIRLKVNAKVAGLDKAKFEELVEKTKSNCPISRLYNGNTKFNVEAVLEA